MRATKAAKSARRRAVVLSSQAQAGVAAGLDERRQVEPGRNARGAAPMGAR